MYQKTNLPTEQTPGRENHPYTHDAVSGCLPKNENTLVVRARTLTYPGLGSDMGTAKKGTNRAPTEPCTQERARVYTHKNHGGSDAQSKLRADGFVSMAAH